MLQRLLLLAVMASLCGLLGTAPAAAGDCPEGRTLCAKKCVDTSSHSDHCGSCGIRVTLPWVCHGGQKSLVCPDTQLACDNRVCVTPSSDPRHCGGCGIECAADQVCIQGSCTLPCPAGQEQCGRVCKDIQVDWTNCGACGKRCGTGERCSAGTCVGVCLRVQEPTIERPPVNQYERRR